MHFFNQRVPNHTVIFNWHSEKKTLCMANCPWLSDIRMLFCALFSWAFTYIMQFTLFVFSSYFAYEISWKEALYSVTCAYAVQHISYCVYLILFRPVHGTPVYASAYIVCAVCIALLLYWFIGRKLPENGHYDVDIRFSMMSFFLIIMLALGLSIAADTMFNAEENNLYYLCKAYDLICCLFVLWEQMDYKNKLNKQRAGSGKTGSAETKGIVPAETG